MDNYKEDPFPDIPDERVQVYDVYNGNVSMVIKESEPISLLRTDSTQEEFRNTLKQEIVKRR
jgi:hypothetical protein